jgi:hypothetical protein
MIRRLSLVLVISSACISPQSGADSIEGAFGILLGQTVVVEQKADVFWTINDHLVPSYNFSSKAKKTPPFDVINVLITPKTSRVFSITAKSQQSLDDCERQEQAVLQVLKAKYGKPKQQIQSHLFLQEDRSIELWCYMNDLSIKYTDKTMEKEEKREYEIVEREKLLKNKSRIDPGSL